MFSYSLYLLLTQFVVVTLYAQNSSNLLENEKIVNKEVFLQQDQDEVISQTDTISLFSYFQGIFIILLLMLFFFLILKYIQNRNKDVYNQSEYPVSKIRIDLNRTLYFLRILNFVYVFCIAENGVTLIDKIPYTQEVDDFLKKLDIYSFSEKDNKGSEGLSFKKIMKYYNQILKKNSYL